MQDLLTYIQENQGSLDNAELLALYDKHGSNASLKKSMKRSPAIRDAHVRYQVWKLLPDAIRQQYKQDLTLEGTLMPPTDNATPTGEMPVPTGKEEDEEDEDEAEDYLGLTEVAQLNNHLSKLANSLHEFAEDDNAGREKVIREMESIEAKIQSYRKPSPPQAEKTSAFLKTDAEKSKMSAAEIKLYKKALSEKLSKAKAALNAGKDAEKNSRIIQEIEEERLKLG